MIDWAHSPMAKWKIAAVIFLCSIVSLSAEPPPPTDPASVQSPANPADDADPLKLGGRNTITLSRQQSVIQCIELAQDAIRRKDYLAVAPLIERIMSEPNSFVPIDATTEVGAYEEVKKLMQQLPAELRRRLDEPRRISARSAWDEARSQGSAEVGRFLERFGDLPLGVAAWWWLGCHERDHGRRQLAASAFARIVDHPHSTSQQQAIALISEIEELLAARQTTDAVLARDRLKQLAADLVIVIGGQSQSLARWLEAHPIDRPQSSATVDSSGTASSLARLQCPVLSPVWKHSFHSSLDAPLAAREQQFAARAQQQREQGVTAIQLLRPMIVNDLVIVRTLEAIQAFSLATGELRWTVQNAEYQQIKNWIQGNAHFAKTFEWAERRSKADSLFGRMATDGRQLFVLQEPDRLGEFHGELDPRGLMSRKGPRFNTLCSLSLESGELLWRVGGPDASSTIVNPSPVEAGKQSETIGDVIVNSASPFSGVFFLGSPLVLDDVLYTVAQRETTIQLLAIDSAHGSLLWSLDMGSVLLPITDDLQRSRVACPVVWHDGVLICSTGAGAVVAVDPSLKTMIWGYRYSATTIASGDLQRKPNHHDVYSGYEPWWDSWREPFAEICQSRIGSTPGRQNQNDFPATTEACLIFSSPETDQLHSIRISDGKPIWRIPRDGGLIVAGIDRDLVIIVEGNAVRGHDVRSGRMIWRTLTTEVSGPAVFVGSALLLELQTGGFLLLDVQSGKRLADLSQSDSALGALIITPSDWIAFSPQSLMRLPQLGEVRESTERQLQIEPNDESLLERAAFLDLQAGDFTSARKHLDSLPSESARPLRRQSLIELLKRLDPDSSQAERTKLSRELKELSANDEQRFTAAIAIATAAITAGDYIVAVDAALDGVTAELDQTDAMIKSPSVNIRRDRVLLGLVDEACRKVMPNDLPAIDALFSSRLNTARKSREHFAIQRLIEQWQGLDWSRRVVVLEDEKVLRKRSPGPASGLGRPVSAEAELMLLDAAGSDDQSIAQQALEKLARRFDRAAAHRDAAAIRRRILREFAALNVSAGSALSKPEHDKSATDISAIRTKPIWPEVEPTWERQPAQSFEKYSLIPVHAEPGSLAERIDVWIDFMGSEILFRGETLFQSGQDEKHAQKLKLPPAASPYRGPVGYMLREAWGIGRIVVLLVGSELFAISPLDENGEPDSRFLWASPIELQGSPGDLRVVVSKSELNHGKPLVIDQLNRPVGKVGPVRAGYLCFQKGTKLVAVETQSGGMLWERLDLPANATILGDDHSIVIWRDHHPLEVLSAVDGRKIGEHAWKLSPETLVHHRGTLAWTVLRNHECRLELHDLRANKLVWSRKDHHDARVAVLDPETLVIATPDGFLHILAARTGAALCEPIAVNTASPAGMVAWHDFEHWFIALNHPSPDSGSWNRLRPSETYRRQLVTGMLLAIDRQQPRILWQKELVNEPLSLDQSRASPVLIQNWKLSSRRDVSMVDGILKVTDKRTGINLIDEPRESAMPFFLLNPDPQQGILELKLPRETIRMFFRSDGKE